MSIITLNIEGSIQLVIVSFYKNDEKIEGFLSHFRDSLKSEDIIVVEEKFNKINQLISFFKELRKKYSYNCVMLVTHGNERGDPTYEETKVEPGRLNKIVENWPYVASVLTDACVDCLGFLAIFNRLDYHAVDLLRHGNSQLLHIVTPAPGKPLEITSGAEAMALFIDILAKMQIREYTPEHLELAEKEVNQKYPGIIKLWLYGDTIGEFNDENTV